MNLYDLIRGPLFLMDPEGAHELVSAGLRSVLASATARRALRQFSEVSDPSLRVGLLGLEFPNPVGLAAGFDKQGELFNALGALGFGFVEIGTVTALAQPGNPRPRLFRLPLDAALLNRMGFNNAGAERIAERLAASAIEPILGINLGKSKATPLESATEDYLRSVDLLQPFASYLVINVSSPNTPGLRTLQDAGPLRELVRAVTRRVSENARSPGGACPVLVKLAPDLTDSQLEEAVDIAVAAGARGLIATNTTISREGLRTDPAEVGALGPGGISGAPLRVRAREVVARVFRHSAGRLPVIGVGGIMTPDDAWESIRAGASLLQVYTGFVYAGPSLISQINRGLVQRLRQEGMTSLHEAVGIGAR